jgi:hypothetical protein
VKHYLCTGSEIAHTADRDGRYSTYCATGRDSSQEEEHMVLGHGASEQVIGTNCPQLSATAPITQPLSCFLASDERTYPCLVAEGGPKGKQNSNGQRPRSCASKSNGRASPFYSDKGRGCGSGASCPIHPCPSRPQQERAGATRPAAAAALTYFKERGKEAYRMIGANRSSDRGWRADSLAL